MVATGVACFNIKKPSIFTIVAMNDDYFPVSLQHQSFHCLVENLLLEMCAERGLSQAYHTRDSGSLPIQSISDLY